MGMPRLEISMIRLVLRAVNSMNKPDTDVASFSYQRLTPVQPLTFSLDCDLAPSYSSDRASSTAGRCTW